MTGQVGILQGRERKGRDRESHFFAIKTLF